MPESLQNSINNALIDILVMEREGTQFNLIQLSITQFPALLVYLCKITALWNWSETSEFCVYMEAVNTWNNLPTKVVT